MFNIGTIIIQKLLTLFCVVLHSTLVFALLLIEFLIPLVVRMRTAIDQLPDTVVDFILGPEENQV